MRRLTTFIVLAVATASFLAFRPGSGRPATSVSGVWRIVAFIPMYGPQADREIEITQPSIVIFTERHFATVFVSGMEPRTPLPENPTDEQLLAAWGPLQAIAGTYEIEGDEIRSTLIVSKSPNDTGREGETSMFELDGDALYRIWLDERGNPALKVKHRRVE